MFRLALICVATLTLVVPATASAQCGEEVRLPPTGELGDGPAPLAVGDSVMLGAVDPLRRAGFEVDVAGCRLWSQGLELLAERARKGSLPDLVVIGLGTNWSVTTDDIGAALRVVGPDRTLGLVTPRELGGESSSDQTVIRQAAERWPDRVRVIDWAAASAGRRDWVYDDGVHLQPAGARALARLMRQAALAPEPEPEPELGEELVEERDSGPSERTIALLGRGSELGSGSGSSLPAVLAAVLAALVTALLLPLRRKL